MSYVPEYRRADTQLHSLTYRENSTAMGNEKIWIKQQRRYYWNLATARRRQQREVIALPLFSCYF